VPALSPPICPPLFLRHPHQAAAKELDPRADRHRPSRWRRGQGLRRGSWCAPSGGRRPAAHAPDPDAAIRPSWPPFSGRIKPERIEESVLRILAAKERSA
jgi:hypothetical protein